MVAYILKRLALALVTILLVSILVFLLVHAGKTTPGVIALGAGATPAEIVAYNQKIGWNDPLVLQYLRWLGGALHGDLGVAFTDGRNIGDDILTRLPVTASLAVGATLVSAILGIVLGVTAAVRGGAVDRIVTAFTGIIVAVPAFWLGIVLVFVLAVQNPLLPATGYIPFGDSPSGWATSLILPVATLGLGGAAFVARQTRASMIDALTQEHIRTLRATGTPTWRILYIHALRFASLPIVAGIALQFIALFGGSVIIEQLFALPGLGLDIQAAVGQSDAPVVQGVVVIATAVVVAVNLLLELASAFLDPKLRVS